MESSRYVPVLTGPDLQWARDSASKRNHLLSSSASLAGKLSFENNHGSRAQGETAHGVWTFKREGFLQPRVSIRRPGSDATIGMVSLSASGSGILTLPGGVEYRFSTSGWCRDHWRFEKRGQPVVRFERSRGGAKASIENTSESAETMSILLLLGSYLPVLTEADDAALAASMAAVVACM
jgi:hypothetical protein